MLVSANGRDWPGATRGGIYLKRLIEREFQRVKEKARLTYAPPHTLHTGLNLWGRTMMGGGGWGEEQECNDAWSVGGWDIGAALSNLRPQATPQQGDTARGGGLVSRGEAEGATLPKTAYKWREMTVKWVTVQMAEDAGSTGDWHKGTASVLADFSKLHLCDAKSKINTMSSIPLAPMSKSGWKLKFLFLPCWEDTQKHSRGIPKKYSSS